jgi:hypothetical protein
MNKELAVFCSCRSALVGPDHHSAKKVLILTMKLWKMKMKWPGPLCSPLNIGFCCLELSTVMVEQHF